MEPGETRVTWEYMDSPDGLEGWKDMDFKGECELGPGRIAVRANWISRGDHLRGWTLAAWANDSKRTTPNVLRLFRLVSSNNLRWAYLVMERTEDRLDAIIRERRLTPRMLGLIVRGVCDGLEALHKLQIVHRAIRPFIIHVGANEQPKIGGFDFAECGVAFRRLAGHRTTMAPEVVLARDDPTHQTTYAHAVDVFGLGCTIWMALAGEDSTGPFVTPSDREKTWNNIRLLRPVLGRPVLCRDLLDDIIVGPKDRKGIDCIRRWAESMMETGKPPGPSKYV